jgi:aminoglycoside phosphotransferase (APT) family kinase protein
MFDPNEEPARCEQYLSRFLGGQVDFLRAERLTQSTREAPWRLDVYLNGMAQSYVLQLDSSDQEHEYLVLKAMEAIPIPIPRAYGLDLQGEALGEACFFEDFIAGESLLGPMQIGEAWAEELFINSVCSLNAVKDEDLGDLAHGLKRHSAHDALEGSYASLNGRSLPILDAAYRELNAGMPTLPALRFSNGDLWLDNFIIHDKKLAGIIDFEGAMFSDPIYEFLLSFFVSPVLQGHGTEARYCERIGYDPAILNWYHGLEYFEVLCWALLSGKGFVHHTADSLQADLKKWLNDIHS